MELTHIILVLVIGTAAGFVNTVAGGGSLVTLPLLMFLGMNGPTANGTNRVAILVQCVIAVAGFKRKGVSDFRFSLQLSVPAVLGAVIGALFAVDISDAAFRRVLGVVMILVLALILWNPSRRYGGDGPNLDRKRRLIAVGAFFLVGIYGGFIQAGVGFVILAALTVVTGMGLVESNSHKVFIVATYIPASLLIFIWNGQVEWVPGLVLAVGNGVGGWFGSHWAVAKGEKWVRRVLVAAVLAMAAKLLGLIPDFG